MRRAARAAERSAGTEPLHILAMKDKMQHCGASERAARLLLETSGGERRRRTPGAQAQLQTLPARTQHGGCSPGRRPGLRRAGSGQAAAPAAG